jgi:hypothetical protein
MNIQNTIFLSVALAVLTSIPVHAQPGRGQGNHSPSDRGNAPRQQSAAPADRNFSAPRHDSVSNRTRFDQRDSPLHHDRHAHHDVRRRSDDRFSFSIGLGFVSYPQSIYYGHPYFPPRYDYVEYYQYPVYTTYVEPAYGQYAQPTSIEIGQAWGTGLRQGYYVWDQFIGYLKAHIVTAPVRVREDFRQGFVIAFGINGDTAFANSYQWALQR